MLGEKVGEETGKVSVRRVLATEGDPKLEVSFQSTVSCSVSSIGICAHI